MVIFVKRGFSFQSMIYLEDLPIYLPLIVVSSGFEENIQLTNFEKRFYTRETTEIVSPFLSSMLSTNREKVNNFN